LHRALCALSPPAIWAFTPVGACHWARPPGPASGRPDGRLRRDRWTGYGERSMRSSAPRPTVAIPPRKERDALTRGFRSASGRSQRTCSGAVRAGPSLPPTVSWGHWLRRRRDPQARFLNFTLRERIFGRFHEGPASSPGLFPATPYSRHRAMTIGWPGRARPRPGKRPALRA